MNADYLDAVASRSGGYRDQGDFLADQYQRLGDLNRNFSNQMAAINLSGITSGPKITSAQSDYLTNRSNLMDSLGKAWGRSFGTNRIYNLAAGPTDSPELRAMNENIEADRRRSSEAKQQINNQLEYARANAAPTIDFGAARERNIAEQQTQDLLGQASAASQPQFYVPGVGYTSLNPHGYGDQNVSRAMDATNSSMARSGESQPMVGRTTESDIDDQLARGTIYNGAAAGVPRYALARQQAIALGRQRYGARG